MNRGALRFDANLKWMFTELPMERRFDAAAAAGFSGVEFASPYDYPAAELAGRLRDAGLEQVLINSPMGTAGSDTQRGSACLPHRTAEFRAGIETALAYATELGCGLIHVVAGAVPAGLDRDRAFAQYVSSIGWAADRAAGTGVGLVLEHQNTHDSPGFLLQSQDQAAAVAEIVGPDRVGVLFDVYHAQREGGGLTELFARTLPWISHIQIADAPTRHEPGTGELNWRYLFGMIADSGYAGWIGCEYAPVGETVAGLGWMKELVP